MFLSNKTFDSASILRRGLESPLEICFVRATLDCVSLGSIAGGKKADFGTGRALNLVGRFSLHASGESSRGDFAEAFSLRARLVFVSLGKISGGDDADFGISIA